SVRVQIPNLRAAMLHRLTRKLSGPHNAERTAMSLEDRVHASVDQAVRSLVKQVLTDAIEDRNAAVTAARDEALAEAEQEAESRLADAEARHRTHLSDALVAARADER